MLLFSAILLASFSTGVASFFQHIIYQLPLFTVLDTSLCPCWVFSLFHWLKWRTRQVSKYLNMAMLHSEIFFFLCICDQSSHSLGSPSPKASKGSIPVSCRRCRIWSKALLYSFYWLTGLSQALVFLSGKSVSLISTQEEQDISTKLNYCVRRAQKNLLHDKMLNKRVQGLLTVVPLCFFLGLQMSFYHITYQAQLQPWISFHKMMNSY